MVGARCLALSPWPGAGQALSPACPSAHPASFKARQKDGTLQALSFLSYLRLWNSQLRIQIPAHTLWYLEQQPLLDGVSISFD